MPEIVRNRTKADLARRVQGQAGRISQGRRAAAVPRLTDATGLPMLRTSERSTFKKCRFLWWHEFEEKLKPLTDVPPLRFGNLIHQSLAPYYVPGTKRGPRPWITFERLYEEECKKQETFGFKVDEDEVWTAAGDLGQAMLKHYVEWYTSGVPDLPDEMFEVILTEIPFQRVIYKPWTYDPNYPPEAQASAEPWFIYVGIIDGIWRHRKTKRLHIVDHKTAKAIMVKYLSLDPQSTAYWTWGLDWVYEKGYLKPNEKPAGMLFNIIRKAVKDERPESPEGLRTNKPKKEHYVAALTGRRGFSPKMKLEDMAAMATRHKIKVIGAVSEKQPAPYFARVPIYRNFNERELARESVLREFEDMERTREEIKNNGGLPYKNNGQFTCPGCWLFDVCELHEIGQDYLELKTITTKSWDPYAEHEIAAAERK